MVSDFVDEASSLAEVCRRPESRSVLYSLFDDALRSWRRDALVKSPLRLPITHKDLLGDVVKAAEIVPEVISESVKFGATKTPVQLFDELSAHSEHDYRIGTIHGDLHPGNVMVRRQEAILIDFASIWENRPIIADLACLEVAACFTIAPEGCTRSPQRRDRRNFGAWRKEIDRLFKIPCLQNVPPLQETANHDWLWTLCRQTRSMASQAEASSAAYACALAIYLLRRARLATPKEHPAIGGLAIKKAEEIIRALAAGEI